MNLTPIFVISLGRSGSTLVMELLGFHPKIAAMLDYPAEVRIAQYWIELGTRINRLDLELVDRSVLYQQTRKVLDSLDPEFLRADREELNAFAKKRIRRFYSQVSKLSNKSSVRFFAEKFLFDPDFYSQSQQVFPNMKTVFLVRDPRDMICSIFSFNRKQNSYSFLQREGDLDIDLVDRYIPILDAMTEWWKHNQNSCSLLRYEDLILKPVSTVHQLFSDLELEIGNEEMEAFLKQLKTNRPASQKHMTSRSVDESIGRWRAELSQDAADRAEQKFRSFLETFDYD